MAEQLTEEQEIWGAQVTLAAAMTLWHSLPTEEKQEVLDEVVDSYDPAHIFAYTVALVESLGFAVEAPREADTPIGQYL